MSKTENNTKQWLIRSWFSCFWVHKTSFFIWCLWSCSTDSVVLVQFWCLNTTAWSRSTDAVVWILFSWFARKRSKSSFDRDRCRQEKRNKMKSRHGNKLVILIVKRYWTLIAQRKAYKPNFKAGVPCCSGWICPFCNQQDTDTFRPFREIKQKVNAVLAVDES
jgi:hypothetical protein